jgi:transcriptional regulator with XRE-family HTH domain
MNKDYTLLKLHLMKQGISQTKMASETGLHKNTITKLLRTGEGTKSVKELARLWLKIEKDEFYSLLNH